MFEEEQVIEVTEYICKKCGSVFFTTSDEKLKQCAICGGNSFASNNSSEKRNLQVIPFYKTIAEARRNYRSKVAWNPLIPSSFKNEKNYQAIQKVFIPSLLTNINYNGQLYFRGKDKENKLKNRVEVKKYDICEDINVDYENVFLNASTQINEKKFSNICNYSYKRAKELNAHDIEEASYLLEDISIKEIGENAKAKIKKHSLSLARSNIKHDLKKLKVDDTKIEFSNSKEILLPVYLLTIRHKDKFYQFLMNGENGKTIFNLPISGFKTFLYIVITFGIILLIEYLLVRYLWTVKL